jgi:hypothetical protein
MLLFIEAADIGILHTSLTMLREFALDNIHTFFSGHLSIPITLVLAVKMGNKRLWHSFCIITVFIA